MLLDTKKYQNEDVSTPKKNSIKEKKDWYSTL
jgi:hypothetical protein